MFKYNFENLEVWQISLQAISEINRLVKKFPAEEKYVLGSQLRRAILSVALNIAEGHGRGSKKDFGRFIFNAIGSTLEAIACLKIAIQEKYLKK